MANLFLELAKKETTLSPLLDGREKLSMEDVVKTYPDGITVIGFDFVECADKKGNMVTFPVLVFKEDTTKFFFGGLMLQKICTSWAAKFEEDTQKASLELEKVGGVKMRFEATRTNSGNSLYAVKFN